VYVLSRRPCICIIFTAALYCMCRCLVISGTSEKLLRVTPRRRRHITLGALLTSKLSRGYRRAFVLASSRSKIMITDEVFDVQFSTLYTALRLNIAFLRGICYFMRGELNFYYFSEQSAFFVLMVYSSQHIQPALVAI
jgi:hypothetical protein